MAVENSEKELIEKIVSDGESFYGSLENPGFGKIAAAREEKTYDPLILEIKKIASKIEDIGDPEHDRSFNFYIENLKGNESLCLNLSMVGRYACVTGDKKSKLHENVLEILDSEKIVVLPRAILDQEIQASSAFYFGMEDEPILVSHLLFYEGDLFDKDDPE